MTTIKPLATTIKSSTMMNKQSNLPKTEEDAKAHLLLGIEAEGQLDWNNAVEHYLTVINLAPIEDTVRYFGHNNLAYSLLQLRRFDEAQMHCIAAIEVNDDRHNAYKNLGLACEGLGRYSDAAACFMKAAIRNPADKRAWLHLQKLLANAPELLSQCGDLANSMALVQQYYEARGGVPKLN